MGMLEIVGGFLLIAVCAVIIVAVTAQESKERAGTISGESTGTFFDKTAAKPRKRCWFAPALFLGLRLRSSHWLW